MCLQCSLTWWPNHLAEADPRRAKAGHIADGVEPKEDVKFLVLLRSFYTVYQNQPYQPAKMQP